MPITLGRSTQNVTTQQSVEAHAALTSMKNHLQQRIDKAWLPPGVLRVRNLKAPAEGAADPGIKVTRDRWYHMFSRKSTRLEASANYVRNLFQSAYGDRIKPTVLASLMKDVNDHLAGHGNQLGARSFVAFVDRFDQYAGAFPSSPPPSGRGNEVTMDRREVKSLQGTLPASMDFRAGAAARDYLTRDYQTMLDRPYREEQSPFQNPFAPLTDVANDPRTAGLRADIDRSVYVWDGRTVEGDAGERMAALQSGIAGAYPEGGTADNVLRDLSQLIFQRLQFTPNDTAELHFMSGQPDVKLPWAMLGGDKPTFNVRPDPEHAGALLIEASGVDAKDNIAIGGRVHTFGPDSGAALNMLSQRLRYTPATTPGTPGKVEVLDVTGAYRIDESRIQSEGD